MIAVTAVTAVIRVSKVRVIAKILLAIEEGIRKRLTPENAAAGTNPANPVRSPSFKSVFMYTRSYCSGPLRYKAFHKEDSRPGRLFGNILTDMRRGSWKTPYSSCAGTQLPSS